MQIVYELVVCESVLYQCTFHCLAIGRTKWQIINEVFELALLLVDDLLDIVVMDSGKVYCHVMFDIEEAGPRCFVDV